jgi:hypothetical protein
MTVFGQQMSPADDATLALSVSVTECQLVGDFVSINNNNIGLRLLQKFSHQERKYEQGIV